MPRLGTLALTGHGPLTASPARTNRALFLHRAVRLIILRRGPRWTLPVERRVWRWGGRVRMKVFLNSLRALVKYAGSRIS